MRWPARFRADEGGFTLVELIIGVAIVGLLTTAIASALIVTLRTTGVTNKRMSESHDVQITSAYLANDVQSAKAVEANPASGCSGALSPLVTFTYSDAGSSKAVYCWGTAANGETQVTRTFAGGTPIVVAHFAGTARPDVTVAYDNPAQPTVPVSVTIVFTKASDCTLDCTYTLFGSRRSFNPPAASAADLPVGDVVLLSTGAQSPLWVQGQCPHPGTLSGCIVDPAKTALPISDVTGFTAGWSPTPLSPLLSDSDPTTAVTSAVGSSSEARVLLGSVDPPDLGVLPTLEFHVTPMVGTGSTKMTLSIYNGSALLASASTGNISQPGSQDWLLTAAQASAILSAGAYGHLTVGFAVTSATSKNGQSVAVDGVAFDAMDLSTAGQLTVKGPLYINSQRQSAVTLTGKKTGGAQISILDNGPIKGDFRIWSPGGCPGCNHNTVTCSSCTWVGQQPWTSYQQSIPDPLRSLPEPDPATLIPRTCPGTVCLPGVYSSFSRTSNTALSPGIYYMQHGMSITASAALTCVSPCTGGVMLFIGDALDSSVTFAGSSSVNLPALNSKVFAGGLYDGIVMFQARHNQNELKFAGNSGSGTTNVLGGIVYVPGSKQVTLATGSASLTAKAIVAQNVKVSSAVTIG
jgi:prepilin-type N-terminal cleavage/methylation domain-containing protein